MVKFVLNTQKGTTLNNDDLGKLPAGTAIPISDKKAQIARFLTGVVVFDKVAGAKAEECYKNIYSVEEKDLNTIPLKTYQDFLKEIGDVKVASEKWKEYKKENNIKG